MSWKNPHCEPIQPRFFGREAAAVGARVVLAMIGGHLGELRVEELVVRADPTVGELDRDIVGRKAPEMNRCPDLTLGPHICCSHITFDIDERVRLPTSR